MDGYKGTGKNDLYRYSKELAQDFKFADELNSTALLIFLSLKNIDWKWPVHHTANVHFHVRFNVLKKQNRPSYHKKIMQ